MKPAGILIIGGTGFLGAALCKRLSTGTVPIHVLARHAETSSAQNVTLHRGSIDDIYLLRQLLPLCGTVIHAASTTTPGTSVQQPSLEASQNILPTLRFLEVLREFEDRHLIFFSSGGTFYGNPAKTPVKENQVFAPQSYYGAGKVAIEAFLQAYQGQGGGVTTILRPSNVYGPGQAFRQGFGVIRTMLEHAKKGSTLQIWGNGEIVRDFIYIDDLITACVALLSEPHSGGSYNLGSGQGYSINQVLRTIESVCELKLDVNYLPARRVDVQAIVLDIKKIQQSLPWTPVTPLEQGISSTWAWLSKIDTQ